MYPKIFRLQNFEWIEADFSENYVTMIQIILIFLEFSSFYVGAKSTMIRPKNVCG